MRHRLRSLPLQSGPRPRGYVRCRCHCRYCHRVPRTTCHGGIGSGSAGRGGEALQLGGRASWQAAQGAGAEDAMGEGEPHQQVQHPQVRDGERFPGAEIGLLYVSCEQKGEWEEYALQSMPKRYQVGKMVSQSGGVCRLETAAREPRLVSSLANHFVASFCADSWQVGHTHCEGSCACQNIWPWQGDIQPACVLPDLLS